MAVRQLLAATRSLVNSHAAEVQARGYFVQLLVQTINNRLFLRLGAVDSFALLTLDTNFTHNLVYMLLKANKVLQALLLSPWHSFWDRLN